MKALFVSSNVATFESLLQERLSRFQKEKPRAIVKFITQSQQVDVVCVSIFYEEYYRSKLFKN